MRKAGEIIPEVVCVNEHNSEGYFELPKICPSCSSTVIREEGEAAVRCINPDCPAQLLRNIIHFCSRDAMDIEGLGPAIIEVFVNNGLIEKQRISTILLLIKLIPHLLKDLKIRVLII